MFYSFGREQYPLATLFKWFLLAFLAGNVNAGGYMACHRFVTHVTGFATLFGIDLASGALGDALGMLSVPFFFLLGAMLSAFFVDVAMARGRAPHYALIMGVEAALLLLAATLGRTSDYILMLLLCMAMGLQNAAISSASGGLMRTTHLTGITTDLGIGIVRLFFGRFGKRQRVYEMNRVALRIGTIASFALGCAVGAMLFLQVHYLSFLLPCVIAIYAGSVAVRSSRQKQREAAKAAHTEETGAQKVS